MSATELRMLKDRVEVALAAIEHGMPNTALFLLEDVLSQLDMPAQTPFIVRAK